MKQVTSIAMAWLVLGCPAYAASFDCAKAQTQVENLICADAELSKLDDDLAAAYIAALKKKPPVTSIRQSQKTWLKYRDDLPKEDLAQAYHGRLSYLLKEAAKAMPSTLAFTLIEDDITTDYSKAFCQTMADNLNSMPSWPPAYCERPLNPAFTKLKQLQWRTWTLEEYERRWYLLAEARNDDYKGSPDQRWTDEYTQRLREWIRNKEYFIEEIMLPENTDSSFLARRLLKTHSTFGGLEATQAYRKKTGQKPFEIHQYPGACNVDHITPLSDDGTAVKTSAITGRPATSPTPQLWLYETEPGQYRLLDQFWTSVSAGFKTGVLTHNSDTCKILYTKPKQIQGVKK